MRRNLIAHMIFLASEKYCMTNQKPERSEKIHIGFSHLWGGYAKQLRVNVCSLLSQNHGFKVCRH